MKYLIVIEYETVSPLVLGYNTLECAETLYGIDNIGKRVTMFVKEQQGLIEVYNEMKMRTQA